MKVIILTIKLLLTSMMLITWTDQKLEVTDGTELNASPQIWQSYTIKQTGDLMEYEVLMKKRVLSHSSENYNYMVKMYRGEGTNPSNLLGQRRFNINFNGGENSAVWKKFYLGGVADQAAGQIYTFELVYLPESRVDRSAGAIIMAHGNNGYRYGISSVSNSDICFRVGLGI